ncbi:CAZyme family GH31 [Penicillium samsonianum]|uniref:CAZyme family GH31 n=1 Tax=Penicillium samsonianum TaxID=1882272 RepID=UPI002546AC1B|nr:CAZyme family GH31 [Penicillium samsonianum]KAJ6123747.1 CAZyme family GH31 [Penicillium samsonianum]
MQFYHEIKFYRRLDDYPILIREGIIIPIDAGPAPGNGCFDVDASEFLVLIGNGAKAIVSEDVGDYTPNSMAGNLQRKSVVHFNQAEGTLTAEPIDRPMKFRFLSLTSIPDDLRIYCDSIDRTKEVKRTVEEGCQVPGLIIV